MKVVALIQTRFNSTRLPGKALMDLNGMPVIQHIYRRLLGCRMVDHVALCIGAQKQDDAACDYCGDDERYQVVKQLKVVFGSEKDILSRMIWGGSAFQADAILRITGDCWAHDPALLDQMLRYFIDGYPHLQGVCNWHPRTYSEGVDAEVYTMELLERLAKDPACPRDNFATYAVAQGYMASWPIHQGDAYKDVHLSIDVQKDLDLARKILARIGNNCWSYDKTMEAWNAVK